jgi:hypothetical protein
MSHTRFPAVFSPLWDNIYLMFIGYSHAVWYVFISQDCRLELYCIWNVMAHSDAREEKRRGNWRMEWVASTRTPCRNVVYPALLTLMCTPQLPAVD